MALIPNTGIIILNRLEDDFNTAMAAFESFEEFYDRMAGARGGINPKMEMDFPHLARCFTYLRNRIRVENAIPDLEDKIAALENCAEEAIEFSSSEANEKSSQMLQINYVIAKALIQEVRDLLAKAKEHIERSQSINAEAKGGLDAMLAGVDDAETMAKLAKHLRLNPRT